MSIEDIETEIAQTYKWWTKNAFGVTPRETGRLGFLWKLADEHYATEKED